jgi:hypothetical protein
MAHLVTHDRRYLVIVFGDIEKASIEANFPTRHDPCIYSAIFKYRELPISSCEVGARSLPIGCPDNSTPNRLDLPTQGTITGLPVFTKRLVPRTSGELFKLSLRHEHQLFAAQSLVCYAT